MDNLEYYLTRSLEQRMITFDKKEDLYSFCAKNITSKTYSDISGKSESLYFLNKKELILREIKSEFKLDCNNNKSSISQNIGYIIVN